MKIKGTFYYSSGYVVIRDNEFVQYPNNNVLSDNYIQTQKDAIEISNFGLAIG
jgi:hypothetical protein